MVTSSFLHSVVALQAKGQQGGGVIKGTNNCRSVNNDCLAWFDIPGSDHYSPLARNLPNCPGKTLLKMSMNGKVFRFTSKDVCAAGACGCWTLQAVEADRVIHRWSTSQSQP